jgi:hemerythrin-like domain-containing protein
MRAGSDNTLAELDRLEGDHQRAEELHDRVKKLFLMWIDAGWLDEQDADALVRATSELDRIYKEHIMIEEEVVFPVASKTLDNEAVLAMGHEFRARRSSEV